MNVKFAWEKQEINPLSIKRNEDWITCIVCDTVYCRYRCHVCKIARYCSLEHKERDKQAIHSQICKYFIKLVHGKFDFLVRPNGKQEREDMIKEILNICIENAKRSLYMNECEVGRIQLKNAFKWYTTSDNELIRLHNLITTICLATNDVLKAGTQMAACKLLFAEVEYTRDTLADYYRNEGQYYIIKQDYQEALQSYANEVYEASRAFHTEHIRTALAYFNMGNIFMLMKDLETAYSFFMHTIDIWTTRLYAIFQELQESPNSEVRIVFWYAVETENNKLDIESDCYPTLLQICQQTVDKNWNRPSEDSASVLNALGLYWFLIGDLATAKVYANRCRVEFCPVDATEDDSLACQIIKACKK